MALGDIRLGRQPGVATTVATVVLEIGVLLAFAVVGTVFLGLAIASPIALPIAQQGRIALTATEVAITQGVGSLWWLFALGVVLSFGAALATLMNLMRRMEPAGQREILSER